MYERNVFSHVNEKVTGWRHGDLLRTLGKETRRGGEETAFLSKPGASESEQSRV